MEDCRPLEHQMSVVHHYGEDLEHYCPTGFLICNKCGSITDEPEPYKCNLWGKKSTVEEKQSG